LSYISSQVSDMPETSVGIPVMVKLHVDTFLRPATSLVRKVPVVQRVWILTPCPRILISFVVYSSAPLPVSMISTVSLIHPHLTSHLDAPRQHHLPRRLRFPCQLHVPRHHRLPCYLQHHLPRSELPAEHRLHFAPLS